MASLLRRSRCASLALLAALACQRLELGDDDGALTLQGGSGTSGGSSSTGGETGADSSEAEDDDSNDSSTPSFDCDPVLQTGCNPEEKCAAVVASGDVAYVCATDPGELDPLESCEAAIGSGVDGCPAGNVCIADEFDAGLCVPLCLNSNDCSTAICVDEPLHHIPYCAEECSPFEGSCPQPLQCRRDDDRFACEFSRSGDVGVQNEQCSTMNDSGCAEGFVCVAGGLVPECTTDSCCTVVCDTQDDTCVSPSTCVPIFPGPAPGFENFGGCLVGA
jgi:hypothetical protein